MGLRSRQWLLQLRREYVDQRVGQRGAAILHARRRECVREGRDASHSCGEGIPRWLWLHFCPAQNQETGWHHTVCTEVRAVRVPREVSKREGRVASLVDAPGGGEIRRLGRIRRNRCSGSEG